MSFMSSPFHATALPTGLSEVWNNFIANASEITTEDGSDNARSLSPQRSG